MFPRESHRRRERVAGSHGTLDGELVVCCDEAKWEREICLGLPQLAEIRERGYAMSFGERREGAASVAVPIRDHEGYPVAAMSVCGPMERFRLVVKENAALLMEAANGVSQAMGYRG